MKILGLIPARGGSKGIHRKNLAMLCGKPLIQWTIEALMECLRGDWLQQACVSTDDTTIAGMAHIDFGLTVIDRPKELATDESSVMDTVVHAMEWYASHGTQIDAVFLLQPTNPLRTAEDIRAACQMLEAGAQSVVSYSPVGEFHPARMRGMWEDSQPWAWEERLGLEGGAQRQQLDPCYIRDGSVYLASVAYLQKWKWFEGDFGMKPLIIPRDRSVRIDEPFDLEYAEFLLTRQQKLVSNT